MSPMRLGRLMAATAAAVTVCACGLRAGDWQAAPAAPGNLRSGDGLSFRVEAGDGWPVLSHNTQLLPLALYRGATNRVLTLALADGAAPKPRSAGGWEHQQLTYDLSGGGQAIVTVSRLSPAVLVQTPGPSVTLSGGTPKYVAFARAGGPVVVAADKLASLSGDDLALSEPWVLLWFAASSPLSGWARPFDVEDELGVSKQRVMQTPPAVDLPVLVRLAHRPASLAAGAAGLALRFAGQAGTLAVMPLFGGKVLLPAETEKWSAGLPADVLAQCRLWSARLRDWPLSVRETFQADGERGVLAIRQAFQWVSFDDDWKSPPVKAAPVPPMLALALPNPDVTFADLDSRPLTPVDCRLMDTPGKAMAIEGVDAYEVRIAGLGELIGPADPSLKAAEVAPEARPLQQKLQRHVAEMIEAGELRPLLYIYGGIGGTWFSHYYWATTAELAEALAEAWPYLTADLQAKAAEYLRNQWRKFPPLRFDRARYTTGRPRTPYELPWDEMQRQVVYALGREEAYRRADYLHELYGLAAGLTLTGEAPPAGLRDEAAKLADELSRRQDWAILGPSRLRDIRDRHSVFYYNLQGPATYNRWLAGAIGLTRLARRLGWSDVEPIGWYLTGKLAMARVGHARYVAAMHEMGLVRGQAGDDNRSLLHIDPSCAVVGRGPLETGVHQNQELPPFLDLTEEVGRLLGRSARAECEVYLDHLDRSLPLWYISEAPKQQATEHRTSPLQNLSGNVLAQCWVLGKRGKDFARYVDTTRFVGDLYYIRNVAAAIAGYAPPRQKGGEK